MITRARSFSQPAFFLRLEGLALLISAVVLYTVEGVGWFHWVLYLLLLETPDLVLLVYRFGNRVGSLSYNVVHSSILPLGLLAVGWMAKNMLTIDLALIWLSHLGQDRLLGFGFKYAGSSGNASYLDQI